MTDGDRNVTKGIITLLSDSQKPPEFKLYA